MRGQPVNMAIQQGQTIQQLENMIEALPQGSALISVLWGSDPQQPPSSQNWGHTVAFAHGPSFLFFDANQGQFSWLATTSVVSVAQQVSENINNKYRAWNIRTLDIYTLS